MQHDMRYYWNICELFGLSSRLGADIDAKNAEGETSIFLATQFGYQEIFRLLQTKEVDVNIKNNDGNTSLHAAAENNRKDLGVFLLEKGADIDAENKNGNTPLHLASIHGHLEVVVFLLEEHANIDAKNAKGQTALDLAANGKVSRKLYDAALDQVDHSNKIPEVLSLEVNKYLFLNQNVTIKVSCRDMSGRLKEAQLFGRSKDEEEWVAIVADKLDALSGVEATGFVLYEPEKTGSYEIMAHCCNDQGVCDDDNKIELIYVAYQPKPSFRSIPMGSNQEDLFLDQFDSIYDDHNRDLKKGNLLQLLEEWNELEQQRELLSVDEFEEQLRFKEESMSIVYDILKNYFVLGEGENFIKWNNIRHVRLAEINLLHVSIIRKRINY